MHESKSLSLREDVLQNGYCEMPTGVTSEQVKLLIKAFHDFMKLKQDTRNATGYLYNPEKMYYLGYYKERNEDAYQGNKDFFHFNGIYDAYYENSPHKDIKELKILIHLSRLIFNQFTQDIRCFFNNLDQAWEGLSNRIFRPGISINALENITLRVVTYSEESLGRPLILPHYDRGTCTFIIGDDLPGLRLYKKENGKETIKPYNPKSGKSLFISGINFKKATGNQVNPIWHDVVQMKDPVTGHTKKRTSVIIFADIIDVDMYTYDERYDKELWQK